MMEFNVRRFDPATSESSNVASRNLFEWKNRTTTEMAMDANGNLGIGALNPSDLLHVNGGASKPSTNTWTIVSDVNLKTDITAFTDGLDVLHNINPIWFRYNGIAGLPTEELTPGVIAQEVLQVAPYMIDSVEIVVDDSTNESMSVLTYNANALFYLLLNSVKELDQRTGEVNFLTEEIESLSISHSTLQNQYDELNQLINSCCTMQTPSFRLDNTSMQEEKPDERTGIVVYPNPFRHETLISYSIAEGFSSARLLIIDSSGKSVYQIPVSENNGSIAISSDNLSVGTYYCRLMVDGKSLGATRVVKIK